MEPSSVRPWYKKKRYLIPLAVAILFAFGSFGSSDSATTGQVPAQATVQSAVYPIQSPVPVSAPSQLSNDNYYTNSDGNQVHSPAYSNSAPVGASAQCRDGTYSFSQHRSGTCSRHGGVAEWL